MLDLPPTDIVCIAKAIWHEARGEPKIGQRAVAHVIINRSERRGISACAVIHEPRQFSFRFKKAYNGPSWEKALKIAENPGIDPTGGARFFHATHVRPAWRNVKYTITIGRHKFYK